MSNGLKVKNVLNPLVPDAHYSQDKQFSLQIQRLGVDLK